MKKNIIWLLLGILACSCYEDKGNYDYHEIPEINSIDSVKSWYTKYSFDTLKIYPDIQTRGVDEYKYWWVIYNGNTFLDTLCRTKDLTYIVSQPMGSYRLLFSATSLSTGVETRKSTFLEVTSQTSKGWYVVKTVEGGTDMDYFSNDSSILGENVIYSAYNYRVEGGAERLSWLSGYMDPDEKGKYVKSNRLFVISRTALAVYNPANGELTRKTEDVFYAVPEINMGRVFTNADAMYLLNSGHLHKIKLMTGVNQGRFSGVIPHPDGPLVEYHLSNYTAGWSMQGPILFDEISRSFLMSTQSGVSLLRFENKSGSRSFSQMPYDLLFMGTRMIPQPTGSPFVHACALMKHVTDNEYKIFVLNVKNSITYPLVDDGEYNVASSSGLVNARFRAMNPQLLQMYYIDGHKLMQYRFSDGVSLEAGFDIPSDETVTFLQTDCYDHYTIDMAMTAIGTQKGDKYKVYVYRTDKNTGGIIDEIRTFEGKGKAAFIKSITKGFVSVNN